MRKVSYVFLGALLGAGSVLGISFTGDMYASPAKASLSDTYRFLNLFGDVYEKVRSDYVEQPDEKKLIETAINGMLTGLDPHSGYLDTKSFKDMQVQTQGEFGGLGIEITQEDGYVKVVSPIDDTPASRAGILPNDLISAIDGESVQGLTLNQAVDKMRGQPRTDVTLTLLRGANREIKEIKLTRAIIQIKSVKSDVKTDVAYIRITQFNEQTADLLKKAMKKFETDIPKDSFKGYVVDLRNNPGGLLEQSIEVANVFLKRGEIVSTKGRNAEDTKRYIAQEGQDLSNGRPVIVLVNGGSASASEIVSGALQDHKRATILGTRSFGKGSVQTIVPLGPNNGALRLTTARYYTPSGRSIQAKGIEPDIRLLQDVPDDLKGKDDLKGEASLKGHLKNGEDEKTGSQAYVPADASKDKQLSAALDILRGVKKPADFASPSPSPDQKSSESSPSTK